MVMHAVVRAVHQGFESQVQVRRAKGKDSP